MKKSLVAAVTELEIPGFFVTPDVFVLSIEGDHSQIDSIDPLALFDQEGDILKAQAGHDLQTVSVRIQAGTVVGHLQRDLPEIGGRPHGFQHFLLLSFLRGQSLLGGKETLAVSDSDAGPQHFHSKLVVAAVGLLGRGGVAQDIVGKLLVHHLSQTRHQVVVVSEVDTSRSPGQVLQGHALLLAVLRNQQGFVEPETTVIGNFVADVVHRAGFQPGGPDGVEDNAGLQRHVDQALQVIAKRAVQEASREQHQRFPRLNRSERTDVRSQDVQQATDAAPLSSQVLGSQGPHIVFNHLLGRIDGTSTDSGSWYLDLRGVRTGAYPAGFGFGHGHVKGPVARHGRKYLDLFRLRIGHGDASLSA